MKDRVNRNATNEPPRNAYGRDFLNWAELLEVRKPIARCGRVDRMRISHWLVLRWALPAVFTTTRWQIDIRIDKRETRC